MNGKQLKNSILQWAIQGKVVPQDQAPLEVGQGAAAFLFGECHQQCRLHLSEEQVEERR